MYVEYSYRPDKMPDYTNPRFLSMIRKDLEAARILEKSDRIVVSNFVPIRYAYVLYHAHRKKDLETLFRFLNDNGIYSIGRYGEWKYSFMEEAILDGKKTAEKLGINQS